MNAIKTINLTKKYKDKIAVNNLNLEIKDGELFSLLGVNGAGKTTTIKMLSCLIKPSSGDAFLLGDSIIKDSSKVKEKINISPQETAIAPNLTTIENLETMARIYGSPKEEVKEKAKDMMKKFKLMEVEKSRAKILSGGYQRRLSIAMALITNPKILFLDEPTLGLDVIARHELWEIIKSLKGKVSIILTTHYLEEAQSLSDRIGIMVRGDLRIIGTASEIILREKAKCFEDAFIKIAQQGGN